VKITSVDAYVRAIFILDCGHYTITTSIMTTITMLITMITKRTNEKERCLSLNTHAGDANDNTSVAQLVNVS